MAHGRTWTPTEKEPNSSCDWGARER